MASQVPYSGAPSVAAADTPTPYRETSTPTGAFGGATAAATSALGQVTDQASNELFGRAVAMQQMKDAADAQEAVATAQQQLTDSFSAYSTKRGKDAVDGLKPFQAEAEGIRTSIGGSLTNPYTQQLYNQEVRNYMGRLNFSAGLHAAEQNHAYSQESLKSGIEATGNAAMANPSDLDGVYAGLAGIRAKTQEYASGDGADPISTKLAVDKASSAYMSNWLSTLAKQQPFQAQKYYDKAVKEGNIVGEDIGKVGNIISTMKATVGGKQAAQQAVSGADGHYGEGQVSLPRAQDAIGGFESHNNYSITGPETRSGDHALGRYQVMGNNLQSWLHEAGMPAMSQADFLGSKTAQDQLFNTRFGQYMQEGGSFNAAANRWFTGSYTPNEGVTDATATSHGHTPAQYRAGTNAILAKSASTDDIVSHANDIAERDDPGNDDLKASATQHALQATAQQQRIEANRQFQATQTIDGVLLKGFTGGQFPTVNDIINNPQTADAFAALDHSKQVDLAAKITRLANAPKQVTPEMQQQYAELRGMAVNAPDQFLKQDISKSGLPWSMQEKFLDMQATVQKAGQADPDVSKALRILGPQLDIAGLTKEKDSKGLNKFTGELMELMESRQAEKARPLNMDEIKTLGMQMLQDNAQANIFHGGSRVPSLMRGYTSHGEAPTPMWQVTVPPGAASIIKSDPAWGGATPTDAAVTEVYLKHLDEATRSAAKAKASGELLQDSLGRKGLGQ